MTPPTRRPVPPIMRHAFVAVLALWMIMPLALSNYVAQDAIPYVAAGKLARSHPEEVFAERNGDIYDLRPRFGQSWCSIAPSGTDCEGLATAFVAAPSAIPLALSLSAIGDRVATTLMRFAAAAMLAGGMWLLWGRLANRSPNAPVLLVLTALLLTPMAMVPIGLGQTSPILFLSVCLGVSERSRRGGVAPAVTWAAACALKLFPIALVALLAWRRRWRLVGLTAGILAVASAVTLLLVHPSVWTDFVRTTLELNEETATYEYNGAVTALFIRIAGSGDSTLVTTLARVIAIAIGGAVCWFGMRRTDDDTRWAAGYLALLVVTPLVWWHYVWVVIGALGVVLASRRHLTDRRLSVLPIAAAVSVAPSIPNTNGHAWPEVQAVVLLAAAATFCVLARRAAAERDRPALTVSSAGA